MGWFDKLKKGLKKTSQNLSSGITEIFTTQKPTDEQLDELEDLLILSDMGPEVAHMLREDIAKHKIPKNADINAILEVLAQRITTILTPQKPIDMDQLFTMKPSVVVVAGINGSGKTTTIGKLLPWITGQGKSIRVVAGDTFRAAAVEQLKHWCDESSVPVEIAPAGGDPAAIAFQGLEAAQKNSEDVLLIDTAGRLHNKVDLMDELSKIQRVLKKLDPTAPHHGWLVLDATGGQNLIQQVEVFKKYIPITGFIVTKINGTAKGGVIVSLAHKYNLFPLFIGVGEDKEDLNVFQPDSFAKALLGLD